MGRRNHTYMTADDVQAIYLSPASNQEMAEEFRIALALVSRIRYRKAYSRYTKGLPKPPFTEKPRLSPLGLRTEPLRRKHERIPAPTRMSEGDSPSMKLVRLCTDETLEQTNKRDAYIFQLRVVDEWSYDRVAAYFGLTRERIRQVYFKILRRIHWRITHYSSREANDRLQKHRESQHPLRQKLLHDPEPDPPAKVKPEPPLETIEQVLVINASTKHEPEIEPERRPQVPPVKVSTYDTEMKAALLSRLGAVPCFPPRIKIEFSHDGSTWIALPAD